MFRGSCYNIHYKPYAISKIELFVTKNGYHLETAVDCCYRELRLKCHGAPRSDPVTHNKRNTFLQKPHRKWDQETSSDPLFFWKSFIWGKNKRFCSLVSIFLDSPQLGIPKKKLYKTLRKLLIQRYAPFWFFREGSENSFSTTFLVWFS